MLFFQSDNSINVNCPGRHILINAHAHKKPSLGILKWFVFTLLLEHRQTHKQPPWMKHWHFNQHTRTHRHKSTRRVRQTDTEKIDNFNLKEKHKVEERETDTEVCTCVIKAARQKVIFVWWLWSCSGDTNTKHSR